MGTGVVDHRRWILTHSKIHSTFMNTWSKSMFQQSKPIYSVGTWVSRVMLTQRRQLDFYGRCQWVWVPGCDWGGFLARELSCHQQAGRGTGRELIRSWWVRSSRWSVERTPSRAFTCDCEEWQIEIMTCVWTCAKPQSTSTNEFYLEGGEVHLPHHWSHLPRTLSQGRH